MPRSIKAAGGSDFGTNMPPSPLRSKKIALRRQVKRDQLWPDANEVVFSPAKGGWAQMPRTIPMIATLIDAMGGRESAGRLYLVLWVYEYGDGFVEVPDPAQLALEAGYLTNRAERTFSERMELLKTLQFVRTESNGFRDHGFVLLLDPHRVVAQIRASSPSKVPDPWWLAFQSRCANVGISLDVRALAEAPALSDEITTTG